jgi:ribosome-associated toxin RatA of RatAB toxin-antitoxin module
VRRSAQLARSAAHLFDLIEAAERDPDFLPWCASAYEFESMLLTCVASPVFGRIADTLVDAFVRALITPDATA